VKADFQIASSLNSIKIYKNILNENYRLEIT